MELDPNYKREDSDIVLKIVSHMPGAFRTKAAFPHHGASVASSVGGNSGRILSPGLSGFHLQRLRFLSGQLWRTCPTSTTTTWTQRKKRTPQDRIQQTAPGHQQAAEPPGMPEAPAPPEPVVDTGARVKFAQLLDNAAIEEKWRAHKPTMPFIPVQDMMVQELETVMNTNVPPPHPRRVTTDGRLPPGVGTHPPKRAKGTPTGRRIGCAGKCPLPPGGNQTGLLLPVRNPAPHKGFKPGGRVRGSTEGHPQEQTFLGLPGPAHAQQHLPNNPNAASPSPRRHVSV